MEVVLHIAWQDKHIIIPLECNQTNDAISHFRVFIQILAVV